MNKYILIFLLLASPNAFPELVKWVDAEGRVHYSDTPPPPDAKKLRAAPGITGSKSAGNAPASSAPAEPKSIAEREAELKKAQQAKKEADDKAAKQQAEAEARKTRCATLQQNLRALQEGVRVVEYDAQGNRVFLEDEQRKKRIAESQQEISANCK